MEISTVPFPRPGWTAYPNLHRAHLMLLNPEPLINQVYVLLNCGPRALPAPKETEGGMW